MEEVQYDDGTLTANEADEEDEVDDVPLPSHQPPLRRYHRKGLMLLKNSESHTDDSIDDSDGSGVTTTTTATTIDQHQHYSLKGHDSSIRRQQFRQHHNRRHAPQHARYKTHTPTEHDGCIGQSRVASGLKLAQSQAMAVAGFLPMESSATVSGSAIVSATSGRNSGGGRGGGRTLKFSVGSESMAGTDTTSLDVEASTLSVNRAVGGPSTDAGSSSGGGGIGRPITLISRQQRSSFHGRG